MRAHWAGRGVLPVYIPIRRTPSEIYGRLPRGRDANSLRNGSLCRSGGSCGRVRGTTCSLTGHSSFALREIAFDAIAILFGQRYQVLVFVALFQRF